LATLSGTTAGEERKHGRESNEEEKKESSKAYLPLPGGTSIADTIREKKKPGVSQREEVKEKKKRRGFFLNGELKDPRARGS